MGIFTSYFANAINIPEFYTFFSIARSTPSWVPRSIQQLDIAKPSWNLINAIKEGRIDWETYEQAYYLEVELYIDDIYKILPSNAILLCWEASSLPCHRHLLAKWINAKYNTSIQEWE